MDFDWNTLFLLFAVLVGLSPVVVVGVRRTWRWYHRLQSGEGKDSLQERIDRIAKGE